MNDSRAGYAIEQTNTFKAWFAAQNIPTQARLQARIDQVERGTLGDVKPVGDGVRELRIHFGPGYRLYFVNTGKTIILLLCGGDKRTQQKDIKRAIAMAERLK